MIWTKNKPTLPGYYWLRNIDTVFTKQPPRVVKVSKVDDGTEWEGQPEWDGTSLMVLESPDYADGFWVSAMDDSFDWSSDPISLPVVAGSCGCASVTDGVAACSACLPKRRESLGFMYLARRGCGKISAAAWDTPYWNDANKSKILLLWKERGDTVERIERFLGDEMPEFVCGSQNCSGNCSPPK